MQIEALILGHVIRESLSDGHAGKEQSTARPCLPYCPVSNALHRRAMHKPRKGYNMCFKVSLQAATFMLKLNSNKKRNRTFEPDAASATMLTNGTQRQTQPVHDTVQPWHAHRHD